MLRAEDQKADLPKPDADGFISLFNGKDLTGWSGLTDFWSVKDGVISGAETKEHAAPQTFLVLAASKAHPEMFGDFELHYSFKFATKDGNSGMQIRSKMLDEKTSRIGGYQPDCDAGNTFTGIIYDEAGVAGGRGIMSNRGEKTVYDESGARKNEPLPVTGDELKGFISKNGEWNEAVVVAKGNHITYTLNGHLMTDLTDNSPKAVKDGVIGMQLHAGFVMEVQFKDLKIKLLDKDAK